MSDAPLFDPSLKKRKKKQVVFSDDPLGRDADPTVPAPDTIDNHTLNGDAVDFGTKTIHEQTKHSETTIDDDAQDRARAAQKEEDEFKAMFGDLKKKKKKKEIPIDLVRTHSAPLITTLWHTGHRVKRVRAHQHPRRPSLPPFPMQHLPRKTSTSQT
jgi:translation initiation factor 2 subunit 2